jgi:tRNA(fMet)-specific endonuclease VapC
MNLLFDTNIILWIARDISGYKIIEAMNPNDKIVYVSFVNIAEAQSITYQNNWGLLKVRRMEAFLENVRVIEISDMLMNSYIGIDSFSQRNHPDYSHYDFKTPRNMGKNDLWTVRRCDCCYGIIVKFNSGNNRWRF